MRPLGSGAVASLTQDDAKAIAADCPPFGRRSTVPAVQ